MAGHPAEDLRADALAVFRAAIASVDPEPLVRRAVSLERRPDGSVLLVRTGQEVRRFPLARDSRVCSLAFGKASAAMECGLEAALGERLAGGLVIAPAGRPGRAPARARLLRGDHPLPGPGSEAAARAVLAFGPGQVPALSADDIVLVLISGGASALLCAPAPGLSLDDAVKTTELLLGSGAAIGEINCVRKHLSAIKGGRLAAALAPARVVSLILSDVIGDDTASIASGPTAPDSGSYADSLAVLRRWGLVERVPGAVRAHLEEGAAGRLEETPKPGSTLFNSVVNILIGTNSIALDAGRREAERLGYGSAILSSSIDGPADKAALRYLECGRRTAEGLGDLRPPVCLIGGGETTVAVHGGGRGGRNQEMALAFLKAAFFSLFPLDPGQSGALHQGAGGLETGSPSPRTALRNGAAAVPADKHFCFLSAGSDGIDGPTDAAGAFADAETAARASALKLRPETFLADNDSYHFFEKTGGLVKTGLTGTNVCDIQILLVV